MSKCIYCEETIAKAEKSEHYQGSLYHSECLSDAKFDLEVYKGEQQQMLDEIGPSAEQVAGEAWQDRYEMYRNEY